MKTMMILCLFVISADTVLAAEPKYIHVRPGGNHVDIDCPPEGGTVTAYDEVGNVLSTYECAPAKVVDSSSNFDWGLGAGGFYMSADGGPHGGGIEAFFEGRLRINEALKFIFNLGPGIAFLDGHDTAPSLSEFVGIEWQASSALALAFGGRHRAIFDGSGDLTNGLAGEVRLRVVTDSFSFHFGGGVGGAWFPTEGPQPGNFPVGYHRPTVTLRGDGLLLGVNAGFQF